MQLKNTKTGGNRKVFLAVDYINTSEAAFTPHGASDLNVMTFFSSWEAQIGLLVKYVSRNVTWIFNTDLLDSDI